MVFGDVCRFQTTPSKLKLLIDFSRSRRWMEDLVLGLGKWAQRGWQKATEIKTFVRRDWFQLCLLSEMRRFVDMYGFWKGFYQAWCVEMMFRSDQTRPNGVGTQSSIFNLFVVDIPCTFVMCFGFPWKKNNKSTRKLRWNLAADLRRSSFSAQKNGRSVGWNLRFEGWWGWGGISLSVASLKLTTI